MERVGKAGYSECPFSFFRHTTTKPILGMKVSRANKLFVRFITWEQQLRQYVRDALTLNISAVSPTQRVLRFEFSWK
jgi:hypothetical protein